MPPISFTLDLEDNRAPHDNVLRYLDATRRLFDFLATRGIRGTVFVVGELAEQAPDLVKEAVASGHELGLHGWQHASLDQIEPAVLREDIRRGKARLEDISGHEVTGFRAPMFSLVPATRWVTDILTECGFTYSSSVLPARNPLFGDPTCPARPFRWPSGLLELPCPVIRTGSYGLPFLGGVYLRSLPLVTIRTALALAPAEQVLWIYCHPYDLDPDEPFWVRPEAGRAGSRLLWYNRRRMLSRLDRLLNGNAAPPLGERVTSLFPDR